MTLEEAARFAPIVTATVATLALATALITAWITIRAQKNIAWQKATIDFILKPEMDPTVIGFYDFCKSLIACPRGAARRPDVEAIRFGKSPTTPHCGIRTLEYSGRLSMYRGTCCRCSSMEHCAS